MYPDLSRYSMFSLSCRNPVHAFYWAKKPDLYKNFAWVCTNKDYTIRYSCLINDREQLAIASLDDFSKIISVGSTRMFLKGVSSSFLRAPQIAHLYKFRQVDNETRSRLLLNSEITFRLICKTIGVSRSWLLI